MKLIINTQKGKYHRYINSYKDLCSVFDNLLEFAQDDDDFPEYTSCSVCGSVMSQEEVIRILGKPYCKGCVLDKDFHVEKEEEDKK